MEKKYCKFCGKKLKNITSTHEFDEERGGLKVYLGCANFKCRQGCQNLNRHSWSDPGCYNCGSEYFYSKYNQMNPNWNYNGRPLK